MRLLREVDGDFYLSEIFDSGTAPRYAILSHTWGAADEEVCFSDMSDGTYKNKAGFQKLVLCGRRARRDGLEFFWVDSCCIDKSSSSELSEAVNSMFRWYRNAVKCYVYLADVSSDNRELDLRRSRWFTRCWTLQDLLAPSEVEFFSRDGQKLGDKRHMVQQISEITGIDGQALLGKRLDTYSVSERMSWAAGRLARREEDEAYSLLGIFGVSMPIIYGEGRRNAFQRLRRAIEEHIPDPLGPSATGMRLLLTRSDPLRLVTVPANESVPYAILSHRWASEEVLFEHMRIATAQQRLGYQKIKACCNLAIKHGFEYVWVDTCCIDKSSSAELQEAICSMYRWYQNASICYVYLDDLKSGDSNSLAKCRWFKRGWTLRMALTKYLLCTCTANPCLPFVEELIAPGLVEFYDQTWNQVGTKESLCSEIAKITSIDPLVLRGADPTRRTVAERMSWAASRETSRIEDTAYSLMGLFNVFMPMIYGEGNRAFTRLQEEIIRQTEDYTIFSWKANASDDNHRGILAHSPAEFAATASQPMVSRFSHSGHQIDYYPPPMLTSRGLMLSLPMMEYDPGNKSYLGWVCCSTSQWNGNLGEPNRLCILLQEIRAKPQVFARIGPTRLIFSPVEDLHKFKQQAICVLLSTKVANTPPRWSPKVVSEYIDVSTSEHRRTTIY